MAMALRVRSKLSLIQNLVRAESVLTQRPISQTSSENPNLTSSQYTFHFHRAAIGVQTRKREKLTRIQLGNQNRILPTDRIYKEAKTWKSVTNNMSMTTRSRQRDSWDEVEDELLRRVVKKYGEEDWEEIGSRLAWKSSEQAKARWGVLKEMASFQPPPPPPAQDTLVKKRKERRKRMVVIPDPDSDETESERSLPDKDMDQELQRARRHAFLQERRESNSMKKQQRSQSRAIKKLSTLQL